MNKGTVKWFNNQKGYGFITTETGDVFVHHTGIVGEGYHTLEQGAEVTFDTETVDGKVRAINVTTVK